MANGNGSQHTETPAAAGQQQQAPASQALVSLAPSGEIVKVGFDTVQGFEGLQRVARAFAASKIVPEAYRNNVADAIIATELALRIGASPLMVMQNLYIVHGRPTWSSQFLIASFNNCGRFSAIRYRFIGERGKPSWGCVAWATEKATGEKVEGPEVTMLMADSEGWLRKNGSKWQTLPQLMLTYRAATFLVRTTAPELTMGLRTVDEQEDLGADEVVVEAEPAPHGQTGLKTLVARTLEQQEPKDPPAVGEVAQGPTSGAETAAQKPAAPANTSSAAAPASATTSTSDPAPVSEAKNADDEEPPPPADTAKANEDFDLAWNPPKKPPSKK
jgi:hypothetical protein